jgi:glyceraldehyde-3-phosphate dehydrogenase/erythrose-4-phosphate dehydrogenase
MNERQGNALKEYINKFDSCMDVTVGSITEKANSIVVDIVFIEASQLVLPELDRDECYISISIDASGKAEAL